MHEMRKMDESNFQTNLVIVLVIIIGGALLLISLGAATGKEEGINAGLWGAVAVLIVGGLTLAVVTIYQRTRKLEMKNKDNAKNEET